MIDHGITLPHYRLHVVPAVVALASPTWQREVWLDPDQFEDLNYTVRVLFDDFCDADNPSPWLGQCLRSEEEVELMAGIGTAYSAVQDSVGAAARDEAYLDSPGWSAVVAAAARLAQVLVSNDHSALSKLHDAGYRWPLGAEPVASETDDQHGES
ncbi:SCO4402 family protein [Streptomyces goshikiensis]|uniref:SCO4402 family protein n=1 Tax=Streptomyces goshikiensis TaxID=1942 RepID=UPI00371C8649